MWYGLVYLLQNKLNNKCYIGQTTWSLKSRLGQHRRDAKKRNNKINRAIYKYGWDTFENFILDVAYNQIELDELEKYYIEKFQSKIYGYNIRDGGSKGKLSDSTKKKLSKLKKIQGTHPNFSNKDYIKTIQKKVLRENTGEIFDSIRDCARKLDINYSALRLHLIGLRKTCNKERFILL